MSRRVLASLFLGISISAVCLWYAFRGVDLPAMAEGISRVGVSWVLASVLAAMLGLIIRAVRWRLLLIAEPHINAWSLLSATFIGFMANNLLPARLGEVVRAWVLARREEIALPTVLASILVERLLDIITALMLLGAGLALSADLGGEAAGQIKRAGLALLAIVVGGITGLLLAMQFRAQLLHAGERWVTRSERARAGRWLDFSRKFLDGLCAIRGWSHGAALAGLSFLVWAAAIFSFYLLAEGFNLALTPVQVSLVFVIVLFGVAIPSAPGFVGTFHGFCVAALGMVAGTAPTVAAAYATLLHGSQWMTITVIGLGFLLADRSITWSGMTNLARQGKGVEC